MSGYMLQNFDDMLVSRSCVPRSLYLGPSTRYDDISTFCTFGFHIAGRHNEKETRDTIRCRMQ